MGMVHACQKYGKCASEEVFKVAKSISPKDAEEFAKTKHKGLPQKKEHLTFGQWLKIRENHNAATTS